jgi:peptide/nickel transport system permease protein
MRFPSRSISLVVLLLICFVALFAPIIANDVPILAHDSTRGWSFPFLAKESQSKTQNQIVFDWAIWPPIPHHHQTFQLNDQRLIPPFTVHAIQNKHYLGTDELGRDVISGIIHGSRISLLVALGALALSLLITIILSSLAGYYQNDRLKSNRIVSFVAIPLIAYLLFILIYSASLTKLLVSVILFILLSVSMKLLRRNYALPMEWFVKRLIEATVSIPAILLILVISAHATPSLGLLIGIIGMLSWPSMTVVGIAELKHTRSLAYESAYRTIGINQHWLLIKYLWPGIIPALFPLICFNFAGSIIIEAGLSYLGIGVSPDTVTWGSLLAQARNVPQAWWLAVFPGLTLFITVLSIFSLGRTGQS